MDDTHFQGVTPQSTMVFIAYATFLQEDRSPIGIYLNMVTA